MELTHNAPNILALLAIAIGFAGLLVFTPEETALQISEVSDSAIGKSVSITGIAKNVNVQKGNIFFEIENNGRIRAVLFKPKTIDALAIKEGRKIRASGKIELYQAEPEIIIEKVVLLE